MRVIREMRNVRRGLFLAHLLFSMGGFSKSLRTYSTIYETLQQASYSNTENRIEYLLHSLIGKGECLLKLRRFNEAEALLTLAYELLLRKTVFPKVKKIFEHYILLKRSGDLTGVNFVQLAEIYIFHAKLLLAENKLSEVFGPLKTAQHVLIYDTTTRRYLPPKILVDCYDLEVKALLASKKPLAALQTPLDNQRRQLANSLRFEKKNLMRRVIWRIEYTKNRWHAEPSARFVMGVLLLYFTLYKYMLYGWYMFVLNRD